MPLPAALIPFIPAIAQAGMGVGQTIFGALSAGKARRDAERAVKAMRPDQSIMDYYTQAKARYSPDPYRSTYYQQMSNQINRGLATGLSAAQTRRSGLGMIGALTQQSADQQARAAGQAEQMGRQDLSQLGFASRAAAQERQRVQDTQTNLLMKKWGERSELTNMGLKNIYGGLSSAASSMEDQDGLGQYERRGNREQARSERSFRRNERRRNTGVSGSYFERADLDT